MPISSVAGLIEALREHQLLDPVQMDEVTRTLQGRFPEPRALARELLQRGWLTPFQVNHLFQDRGRELRLGHYLLLERLGEGGMGQIFKARHQLMNRLVAVKVIRKERLADPDAVQRFRREIQMAGQLAGHPHIVIAHDACQIGDTHLLVMEYIEGVDLSRLVRRSGPLPVAQAAAYIRQAALGLQHAHERGLVHRDVKPSNLLVTAQGSTVKVLDMGLARSLGGGAPAALHDLTQSGTVVGTPDYIAPEQSLDPRRADIRADIYSLGCTFYFMLAGKPPFPEGTLAQKLLWHQQVEPPALELSRSDVPAAVSAIIRRMMAKRPEDRYDTPAAVADALAPYCQSPVPTPTVAIPVAAATLDRTSPASLIPGSQSARTASTVARAVPYESGWTLGGSSLDPTATGPAPAPLPSPIPPAASPALPAAAPAGPKRKRLWLILGCGGGLALALFLLLWIVLGVNNSPTKGKRDRADNRDKSSGKDAAAKKDLPREVRRFEGHTDVVLCVAFSPRGDRILSGGNDKTVRLWAVEDGTELQASPELEAPVSAVAFSPNGKRALSGNLWGRLWLWELDGLKDLRRLNPERISQGPGTVQAWFSPNGLRALCSVSIPYADGAVQEWNLAGSSLLGTFNTHRFLALALSPDQGRVALSNLSPGYTPFTNVLLVCDRKERFPRSLTNEGNLKKVIGSLKRTPRPKYLPESLRVLQGHTAPVLCAAFSPDGLRVVSGSMDGTVRIWNADTGTQLQCLEGHQDPVVAVAFCANDKRVLSGSGGIRQEEDGKWTKSSDHSIRLWDAETGKELHRFRGHPGGVTCIAVAPGGRVAVSGGHDKRVRLWRLPP
jgi:serine/threonine-protein kinase